jgi:dipeptidyl aminopeptidase/acylaminoacyl peptidase
MKKFILLFAIALLFTGCKASQKTNIDEEQSKNKQQIDTHDSSSNTPNKETTYTSFIDGTQEEIATKLLNFFIAKDYKSIGNFKFTAQVKPYMKEDALKSSHDKVTSFAGEFNEILSTDVTEQDGNKIVTIVCSYTKSSLKCIISFNESKEIQGLNFLPHTNDETTPSNIEEINIEFGNKKYRLPGILTIPKDTDNYPIVILVHGSGPCDKDETIYTNKPFRDIAHGLASNGIGVLRYDKRTFVYGKKMSLEDLTVYDETIDDVVYAYNYLLNNETINPKGIYILGHSLGGYLMPRIAEKVSDANGYIVLAGSARPIEDLLVYQTSYFANLDKKVTDEEQKQIDYIKNLSDKIKSLNALSELTPKDLGGVGKNYYLDLKDYNPASLATKITKPILFLQGKRDYQVTLEDFNLWKDSLEEKDNTTFKLYDGLNHLFMKGEGTPSPKEYSIPSKVEDNVINDISNWILEN